MADVGIDLRRLRFGLAAVVGGLMAAHVVAEVVLRVSTDLFNLNEESTVGTWVSTMLLAASAMGFLLSGRTAGGRTRRGWYLGAAALALLSLDEVAMVHERVGKVISNHQDTGGVLFFAWVIPGGVIAMGLIAALVAFTRRLERRTALLLVAGGALFFLGAIGVEMVGGRTISAGMDDDQTFVAVERSRRYMLTSGLEETLELVGECLVVYGVARHLERQRRALLAVSGGSVSAPGGATAAVPPPPMRLPPPVAPAGVPITGAELRRPAPTDPGTALNPSPDGH